jgi:hypothetical protein
VGKARDSQASETPSGDILESGHNGLLQGCSCQETALRSLAGPFRHYSTGNGA